MKIETCFMYSYIFIIFLMPGINSVFIINEPENIIMILDQRHQKSSETHENFLSIALDSSVIARGFHKFNMSDPKLIKIVGHLSPAYLRIGGNMADCLEFVDDNQTSIKIDENIENSQDYCTFNQPTFTMNGSEWIELNEFAKKTKLNLVFDLNVLKRLPDGSWDSSNALKLIKFSNFHNLNVDWQLGNEPNNLNHHFKYELNATQLARDFQKLRSILYSFEKYKKSLLIGPDTTRPTLNNTKSVEYMLEFLKNGGNIVDVISWHQYYFNGRTVDENSFINTAIFDILKWQIKSIDHIRELTNLTAKMVWLSETSSAWGGGSPKFSDKFLACFIWLDKLGLAAQLGIDVVIRQSIFDGFYALISNDLKPNPDYWISVLFKKLVGHQTVPCINSTSENVRLYCQCSPKSIDSRFENSSSLTVFGMNLANKSEDIRLENQSMKTPFEILVYKIETDENSLLGKNIYLNGDLLELKPNYDLPEFKPEILTGHYIKIPAYSIIFCIVRTTPDICP